MQKTWKLLDNPPQSFYEEHPELPATVAKLLYHRNITAEEQIDEFLNPDYTQDIHDPFLFKDMKKAVERIFQAIKKQEKIAVYGDYDADGVCATVILVSTLKAMGAESVQAFLPNRETEGYGMNKNTVQTLSKEKVNLIITCDCGVSNYEEVKSANDNNIDVIITDHHTVPEQLPLAYAIIHPQISEEAYPDKGLAGGGVAFKLVQGLLKKHKETNQVLHSNETHEVFEKWLLDLVAIASVADMIPLIGESRTLTKYGLVVLNKTKRIGLQKLLLEARLMEEDGNKKRELSADTIGFQIAPRLNAAGRMNHANTAYNLLITESATEAIDLACELNENNQERQKMTDELVKKAVEQIEKEQKDSPILFVLGKGWSTGIIGLIAVRIKDKYYKPTIVLARPAKPNIKIEQDGKLNQTKNNDEITGSGRSIQGFDIIAALQEMPEFFLKFGGHPMACGFTLKDKDKLEEFKEKLTEKFKEKTANLDLKPILLIDAEIDLDEVDWDLYDILEKFKPFGQANEKPKYLAKGLTVIRIEPVGQNGKHLRIMLTHNSNKIRKTIGWNLCNGNGNCIDWSKELNIGDKIDVVFEIDINEWNGNRELQLTIVDLKKSYDTDNTNDANQYANDANHANNPSKSNEEKGIFYKELAYKINGILFEVHNELGKNCNEKQISDAIEIKLKREGLNYEREKKLPPSFEGERFGRNKIDFIIEDKIIVEVKVRNFVGKEEYYQCLRYLEAYDKKLCLLVNFRSKYLKIKRIVNPKAKL